MSSMWPRTVIHKNEIIVNCIPEMANIGLQDVIHVLQLYTTTVSFKDMEACAAIQHEPPLLKWSISGTLEDKWISVSFQMDSTVHRTETDVKNRSSYKQPSLIKSPLKLGLLWPHTTRKKSEKILHSRYASI
ncbi:hypothetical protein TNCV_3804481 [Trichonephila clavipes]|nr:hypothetical protein TNCV_3804481 [Trichonephila clavipes]